MKPALTVLTTLAVLLAGCTDADDEPSDAAAGPPVSPSASSASPSPADESPNDPSTDTSTEPALPEPPHRVSLPTLMRQGPDGGRLRVGAEVYRTATQRQHEATYRSGDLTISGRIAIPDGPGPFPTLVLAHGYIDPDVYVNGQGMTREREWLADHGYVVLHVDYRNHAASDDTRIGELDMRMGYTEDVVNAVHALRRWDGPVDDERMAIVGRSMGGGVVYNALVAHPGLVDAGVSFAPVSSDAVDNFDRWIRPDPTRAGMADEILSRYGTPRGNPAFWDGISARTYFDRITEPVLIHHGTLDDSCPIRWSHETTRLMRRAGVNVTLEVYEGEGHAFGPQFFASMERTHRFLRRHLR
ncbi:prolyl oligopeptidase family serine peptidase [Nocardioides sp. TF02-7]|uniref:alpha/beta hydrolase family protein n=1 Tax=Nocardioides sp. TF02-7 TaxID=2917724 RepID=UPI001F054F8B|nr:prolyl oligopeptidase family serine peptidase [Nocardioides sp. TF02-7]UMG93139.1 prolyl oligopeptidase family serine peptidase [Nocardioides sp. TF02-7]